MTNYTWRLLPALIFCTLAAQAGASHAQDLLRMSDQFDKMDKGDFDIAISKASQCTAARDFSCAETQLRAARKLANDGKNKSALKRAEDGVVAEKARIREEERIIAQRRREQEEEEERQRLAERRARDAQQQAQREAEERDNLNSRIAAAGNVYAQNLQAQSNARAQDQARTRQFQQRQAEANAATARDQQRFAQERAQQQRQQDNQRLQLAQAQQAQPVQAPVRVATPVAPPAPAAPERIQPAPVKKVSNSINTGREAMRCVSVVREKEDLAFNNTCNIQIFVVWCGDLKYSNKHCGDGPAGNSYYTHSINVMPNDKQYARGVGEYHYAACEGGISFGKDEIQDRPDGTFTCVPK